MCKFLERELRLPFFLFLFSFLLSCSSLASSALDSINKQKLWESREWKRLLHVSRSILLYERSEADSDNFFLHRNGKYNFQAELRTLAEQVIDPKSEIEDAHPICRFPARTRWLYKKLNIPLKETLFQNCKEYQKYLKLVESRSVHLVFSSYHLESPASAFGHTLLRLGRPQGKSFQDTELLDMGINSAAQVTTNNAFLYSIMGMFGGFDGTYSAVPYFYKVREYNDFESRDLWTYSLNLSSEQQKRLIDHLWEVGNASFDYYYFSENCSYNLFTLLEVANFDLELVDKLPVIYTLPSHTVQIVHDTPGLVTEVKGSASLRRTFEYYFDYLSPAQQDLVLKSYKLRDLSLITLSKESDETKVEMIDVLMFYLDFKHPQEVLLREGEIAEWKNIVQLERSRLKGKGFVEKPILDLDEAPHRGHPPRKIGLSYGDVDDIKSVNISYRFALHSFMDPSIGQPKLSTLEFGDMALEYSEERLKLKKFELFDIMTLNPWHSYYKPFSYRARIGLMGSNPVCPTCALPFAHFGGGVTWFHNFDLTVYSFINSDWLFHESFKKNLSLNIGPELGIKKMWSSQFAQLLTAKYLVAALEGKPFGEIESQQYFYLKNRASLFIHLKYSKESDMSWLAGMDFFF